MRRPRTLTEKLTAAIIVLASMLALSPSAFAATITPNITTDELTGGGSGTNCSLREAVNVARFDSTVGRGDCAAVVSGTLTAGGTDTIQLGASPYVLDIVGAGDDDNVMGDLDRVGGGNLVIQGAGAAQTTIQGDDSPVWADRLVDNGVGAAGTLTISALTLTGGNVTGVGGAVNNSGISHSLVLNGVLVIGNQATDRGGGINAGSTSLTIDDSTISTNVSSGVQGGGIHANSTTTTIDSSVIFNNGVSNNTAQGGGGVGADTTNLTLTNSVVDQNVAQVSDMDGTPTGGGVALANSPATIRNTTVSNNLTTGGNFGQGAGIGMLFGGSTLSLVNSTVSGNMALDGASAAASLGGGLQAGSGVGPITVVHSTFANNQATGDGSAIQSPTAIPNLRGSILDKTPPLATDVCTGTFASGGYNVARDASCGPNGTTDVPSVDPQIGALNDNSGPMVGAPGFTMALTTHLPALGSPAVDRVATGDCMDSPMAVPLTVDQRGQPRPTDGDGNGTALCDSGSVERPTLPVTAPTPTPAQPLTPAATGENPACAALRAKLKKAKSKKKKRKIRKQLRALGC